MMSLPVPVSPIRVTVTSLGARRSTSSRTSAIAGERATTRPNDRTIGVPWRDEPGVSKLSAGKAVSSTRLEIILRVDGSSSMHPSIAAATRVDV